MAFADWSDGDYAFFHDAAFERIFNRMDFEGLEDEDIAYAEELFERGWTDFNIAEETRYEARMDFADLMGYAVDFNTGAPIDFDWESFRELYDAADA